MILSKKLIDASCLSRVEPRKLTHNPGLGVSELKMAAPLGSLKSYLDRLWNGLLNKGGSPGEEIRPDATAWIIMALAATAVTAERLEAARTRLAGVQLQDGRVGISLGHPEVFWPTALAVLAWHGSPEHAAAQRRAIGFLLRTKGKHFPRGALPETGHDTAIEGWPWVAGTHSWVEPTALSLLALLVARRGQHPRAREAIRLLVDRQLPSGGWNYGNTLVYGDELHPLPYATGVALTALAGQVEQQQVQPSVDYLKRRIEPIRTPLSLAWGLLGLSAWDQRPEKSQSWILESLQRQSSLGEYSHTALSLLVLAFQAQRGLADLLSKQEAFS